MIQCSRLVASSLLRVSKTAVVYTQPQRWSTVKRALPLQVSGKALTQVRWQSQDNTAADISSKTYGFDDIKELIAKPSKDRVLIDTREPSELEETGRIPTALNIPITSQPDSFFISEEDFEDRFGFERPRKDKEVVFYCRAGVRSRAAAQLARQGGWGKTGEYAGSWLDWAGKGGPVER